MFNNYFFIVFAITFTSLACSDKDTTAIDIERIQSIQTLDHDGLTREYFLYVPDSYDGEEEVPLLFNFHGFTGNTMDHLELTDMRPLAESEKFILVYPQGSLIDGLTHWNAALEGPDNKSDADDLGFVQEMVDKISNDYNIDHERIYSCGFSNGAMMSYALACYSDDLIAAVGSVSGAMLDLECTPSHPVPVIKLHGTRDFILPYDGNGDFNSVDNVIEFWTKFNQTNTTPIESSFEDEGTNIEHFQYTEGTNSTSVELYKINEGLHVWFDQDFEGRTTSELIWDFVSQYDINGLR